MSHSWPTVCLPFFLAQSIVADCNSLVINYQSSRFTLKKQRRLKPDTGWVKFNCDGSFKQEDGTCMYDFFF
jgi:hypothetical protein